MRAPETNEAGGDLLELANEWAALAAVTGLRASTLRQYLISLRLLAKHGIRSVADANPRAVRAFMKSRVAAGRSPETANRNLAALTSLMTWLHSEGRVALEQLLELRQLFFERPVPPPPSFLTREQYDELRGAARAVDPLGRFELLVMIGVEAGLRFHEARQLRVEDLVLDVPTPYIRVSRTHGRQNKRELERTVPIRRAFARVLRALRLPPGPVFPARVRRGEELLSPYVHKGTFREWRRASLALLSFRWDWNLLRHTFASWQVQANVTVAKVATWMGNSVEICMRHYAGLVPGGDLEVERAHEGFSQELAAPRARARALDEAIESWLACTRLSSETRRKYAAATRSLLAFGFKRTSDLSPRNVRRFVARASSRQSLVPVRSLVSWLEAGGEVRRGTSAALRAVRAAAPATCQRDEEG